MCHARAYFHAKSRAAPAAGRIPSCDLCAEREFSFRGREIAARRMQRPGGTRGHASLMRPTKSAPRDAVRGVAATRSSKRQRGRLAAVLTRWRHGDLRCAVWVGCARLGDALNTTQWSSQRDTKSTAPSCIGYAFAPRPTRGTNLRPRRVNVPKHRSRGERTWGLRVSAPASLKWASPAAPVWPSAAKTLHSSPASPG